MSCPIISNGDLIFLILEPHLTLDNHWSCKSSWFIEDTTYEVITFWNAVSRTLRTRSIFQGWVMIGMNNLNPGPKPWNLYSILNRPRRNLKVQPTHWAHPRNKPPTILWPRSLEQVSLPSQPCKCSTNPTCNGSATCQADVGSHEASWKVSMKGGWLEEVK